MWVRWFLNSEGEIESGECFVCEVESERPLGSGY